MRAPHACVGSEDRQQKRQNCIFLETSNGCVPLEDGSISNVKVERGISVDLDREAKRVVRNMPKWIPGESAGRAVRARCRLPINFQLH